jgi:hypothetical protein
MRAEPGQVSELERYRSALSLSDRQNAVGRAATQGSRFGSPLVLNRVHWVRPEMVVEVSFVEWTADGLLRHVVYLGDHNGGVSCGFVVCDRGSDDSCFCNARRLQSINSKSIMAGRRSFISRSTSHVSAGIWLTSAEIV